MAEAEVNIYSTPTCPFCHQAKEFLKEQNIPFKDHDVAEDEEARNFMIEKSGQMGVPVIMVGDALIIGFDKPKLVDALKKAGIEVKE